MGAGSTYLVLVPFHSRPAYLRATLASVVAQTDREWAAVVVDDSPDGADVPAVVASVDDARISWVRNDGNLGVAGSFNRCFDIASERGAELACILHADDLLEPGYVAAVRAAHARAPLAACVAPRVTVIDADGAPARTLPDTVKALLWPRRLDELAGERGLQLLMRGQFFYCPSVSYRMDLLSLPAWNGAWRQVMDLDLYARVLLDGGTIHLEPARVFRYRRHEGSMTQINSATMVRTEEETALCRSVSAEAAALGWRRAARAGRVRMAVRLQAAMRALVALARGRAAEARRVGALALRP